MWWVILIAAVVIGGIIGALSSKDGERGAGFFSGALTSGMGCGYVLFQILLWGLGIAFFIWLFGVLF